MNIPALLPDVSFGRLPQTVQAMDFAFEVKRAALGPHIAARWGWDEIFQRDFHQQRFRALPLSRILHHGRPVGTVALTMLPDHMRLDEFYLLPGSQGRGLGSRILKHCLAVAETHGMPVRLQYLRWNPVGSLYRRHGFTQIDETEIHFIVEWRPGSAEVT